MSYMHLSYQNGFIFSSVPLDEDGRPTAAGGTAMQLCSLGFRIASGTKADGSYNWRTFGTGDGFAADWINAGTLSANLIKAGVISDRRGRNSWDLESGDLSVTDGTIKIAGSWNTVEISPETGLVITDEDGNILLRAERDSEDTSNIEVMRIKFGENVLATLNANRNQDCTLYMTVWDAENVPDSNLSASLHLSPKSIEMTGNERVSVGSTRSVFGMRITDAGIQYLNSSYGQWVGLEKYVADRNQSHEGSL